MMLPFMAKEEVLVESIRVRTGRALGICIKRAGFPICDYSNACAWRDASGRNQIRVIGESLKLGGLGFSMKQWREIARNLKNEDPHPKYPLVGDRTQ